ncbi:MAG: hypothetical protein AAGB24_03595 [Bacteroidota bacterium]
MAKIPFTVSARTARLIGQENFSNSEGAIIELVKNSYDADAKVALVVFDIVYDGIPDTLSEVEFSKFGKEEEELLISDFFEKNDEKYHLKSGLAKNELNELSRIFRKKNSLYIIDNGEGMNETTILKKWMKIGTDNKLVDFRSAEGRIKTGAS